MRFFQRLANEPEPEELFKRYFSFLVEQYGFTYTSWCYTSGKLKINVEIGHKSPRVYIAYAGEPDFTQLALHRIIQYFGGKIPKMYYPDHPIEHNIRFVADLFREYAPKIADHIDDWWLPVHKFQYELTKREYEESGQLNDFLSSYKRDFDYLKSKGAT
jgi:hypothetical protein